MYLSLLSVTPQGGTAHAQQLAGFRHGKEIGIAQADCHYLTFERGYGKIFYFQPGHESYSNFYNENVLRVIGNAVRWARPVFFREMGAPCYPALEEIRSVDPAAFKAGVMQNADGSNK